MSRFLATADPPPSTADRKPFGIDKRELWTTSKVVGSPDPAPPYRLEKVFPDLTFTEPREHVERQVSASIQQHYARRHARIARKEAPRFTYLWIMGETILNYQCTVFDSE